MATAREQKLVDIMFSVGLLLHQERSFRKMSTQEVAEWIARQLKLMGFDTTPVGCSWGVLTDKDDKQPRTDNSSS